MKLYLVRHPQPLDVGGLCYGRLDVRIDAESLARTAASVRQLIGDAALVHDRIFSSPSTRCLLLARELASPREPTRVDELMEMDFGSWEGVRWDAVPRGELDAWADDVWRYRPGGAESAALVAERWLRWSAGLRKSGMRSAVAVTHAGLIRVALRCSGLSSAVAFSQAVVDYGSVHYIGLEDEVSA